MTPELVLLDMDGTVYSGDSSIEGADRAIEHLREKGIDVVFLTNYTGRKRGSYSQKLAEMSIESGTEDIVTSGWITANHIANNFPESSVFVMGEPELEDELRDQDVNVISDCEEPDLLVVSNKHDLSYEDLKEVLQGISDHTEVIGTNPDETIPGEDGELPGAGTIIEAVEAMTGKEAKIIGKPSDSAIETVLEAKEVAPEDCMMVGDRLNTDILMGERNGMETVLVLSGVTGKQDLENSDLSPDYMIQSLADIRNIV